MKIGMTLQENEVSILTVDLRSIYPSIELIEAKSYPVSELGIICVSLELLLLRKKCFCTGKMI